MVVDEGLLLIPVDRPRYGDLAISRLICAISLSYSSPTA